MKSDSITLQQTGYFSKHLIDYLNKSEELTAFYNIYPLPENFKAAIEERDFDKESRNTLVNVLRSQYKDVKVSPQCTNSLNLLESDKTFTITTGHQLNIFTGPLYFIYKIITTINTAKRLEEEYPEFNFVPVYWMASEDHDFDEIRSFHLFGKTYSWNSDKKGAVGRMDPGTIKDLIETLPEKPELFQKVDQDQDGKITHDEHEEYWYSQEG
jgi:uncharacterized protein YllA (UPF0747 family)